MSVSGAATSVAVTVRFFARYADLLDRERVDLTLPAGATVAALVEVVRREVPGAGRLPQRVLCAVNLAHALPSQILNDGDEVAFLPPLAGG